MYKKEYVNHYGFLGIGQFGGNLTKSFEEANYPCIVANSSVEDLATRSAKNKLHFRNGQGCHKDRRKSKELLKENIEVLVDEVRAKMPSITILFVCASASGGTGSGMLAGLTLPKTRLNEIKKMAQTNAEIIKKGMEAANDSLFDDDMDFLNTFEAVVKTKKEEKVSSLDILSEFL